MAQSGVARLHGVQEVEGSNPFAPTWEQGGIIFNQKSRMTSDIVFINHHYSDDRFGFTSNWNFTRLPLSTAIDWFYLDSPLPKNVDINFNLMVYY